MTLEKKRYIEDGPEIPVNPSLSHQDNPYPLKIQSPSPKIPFHFQFFTPTKKKTEEKKSQKKTSTT